MGPGQSPGGGHRGKSPQKLLTTLTIYFMIKDFSLLNKLFSMRNMEKHGKRPQEVY